ncbi:MAG: MarR family transcriptional regulator [Candidatus Schmidhempelia sp.]|nr:MarR family transcriptional regulator [Candidatus Schmidhempelia sp.]
MEYRTRKLPTREILARAQKQDKHLVDISGVDLVLSLITTVDLIRSSIYTRLANEYDISEGKFTLLMSLYTEGETTSSELALRIGVTPATVSIMVKRMLAVPDPLISMTRNHQDGRSRLIELTPTGVKLLQNVLPDHLADIRSFAEVLNPQERESLIFMLRKLLRKER